MMGFTNVGVTHGDPASPRLPTGTVTFLFTDIEGSTRLLLELGDAYGAVLAEHRDVVGSAMAAHGGVVFGTEGDALFVAFRDANSAVLAAAAAQRALGTHAWAGGHDVRVRMGIHSGDVALTAGEYVGLPLHQVARVTSAAHGGQVLVSGAAKELAAPSLPADLELVDLGEHRLKDLATPERLFDLRIAGVERSFPPPRTLDVRPNNLPIQLTSFIGRHELETARALLDRTRLLTLTGPGGTGKTRLALQLAAEVLDDFPDGTFFVPLDTVLEPDLVPSAIVLALGIETGSTPPIDQVLNHLRSRRLLLVLDNFEQIVAGAAIVTRILGEAPQVKALVTSRIVLRTTGEQEFMVPPLGLPDVADRVTLETAARSEAVQLFVERAMASMPSFVLTDENAAAVVDIVTRLDGLPLAIELAAARVRILPIDALRSRLTERLGMLVGGPRDRPARQQTLRGAIDWSYDLLDDPDRRLFERFAVFAGGACLTQAEAICGPAAELGRDVLDGLASLGEKSLLRPVPGSEVEPRFAMLATIREYALERLDAGGESASLRHRHAAEYLALAEQSTDALTGPSGRRWLDRLELDLDNFRAALEWASETDDAETAMRLVVALWRFWQIRGHLHEAKGRVARALAVPGGDAVPPALRAAMFGAAGSIAYWRGEFEDVHRFYTDALVAARAAGEPRALAEALYNFGFAPTPNAALEPEYYRLSATYFAEAQAIYRDLGDLRGIANSSWAIATAAITHRDWPTAKRSVDEALAAYRELGDTFGIGWSLHERGLVAMLENATAEAEELFREAMEIFRDSGDVSALVLLLLDFATLARVEGQLDRSWRLAGAADALRVRTGTDLAAVTGPVFGLDVPVRPAEGAAGEQAWDEGAKLSAEDAVRLALDRLS